MEGKTDRQTDRQAGNEIGTDRHDINIDRHVHEGQLRGQTDKTDKRKRHDGWVPIDRRSTEDR